MKRSEMQNKIIKFILDNKQNFNEIDFSVAYSFSDEILFLLEKEGMNPPGYMKPIPFESDGKQYPLIPGDFKNDEGVWCTPGIQEWEPESQCNTTN